MAAAFALTRFTGPYRGDPSSEVALVLSETTPLPVVVNDRSIVVKRPCDQQTIPTGIGGCHVSQLAEFARRLTLRRGPLRFRHDSRHMASQLGRCGRCGLFVGRHQGPQCLPR